MTKEGVSELEIRPAEIIHSEQLKEKIYISIRKNELSLRDLWDNKMPKLVKVSEGPEKGNGAEREFKDVIAERVTNLANYLIEIHK